MKVFYLLLLTCCLNTAGARAQLLQGSFYRVAKERGFSAELFQFSGNHFSYLEVGCTGSVEGKGTFLLKNDSLLLYCEAIAADTAVTALPLRDTTATPTFHFRVINKMSGGALPGATITNRTKQLGTTTDTAGQARLTYSPSLGSKLSISYVGYHRVEILLPAASRQFTVRMGPPYYFEAGDTLVFQLKDVRPNAFAYRQRLNLMDIDDDELPYSHCERISAAVARKLIRKE